ncbi:hypothetical protein ACJJTC_018320 [Scirpophaga incertulas]
MVDCRLCVGDGNIDETNYTLINKMEQIMDRNPDLDALREISEKLTQESSACIYKFAPLPSVDVERSFSNYKWILNVKRNRLTKDNLEKIIIIYYNYLNEAEASGLDLEQSLESDTTQSCSAQTLRNQSDFNDQPLVIDSD